MAATKKRQKVDEYERLPPVAERINNKVYQNTNKAGGIVKWSAKHEVLVPMCRQCGEKQASNEDKDGKRTLCKKCAKNAGCHQLNRPCQGCRKVEANFTDKDGKFRFCGPCAKKAGCHQLQRLCQGCGQVQGNFEDEDGKMTLCKKCAKKAGCHQLQRPCEGCRKVEANFEDKDGKIKFCGPCAIDLGLKPQASSGASMEACQCWHLLEDAVGGACVLTHHVHFENGRTDPTGAEKEGLIPGSKFKPDAFIEPRLPIHLPDETSGEKGAVYLFHGNPWHGFPEGHPKYEANNFVGTPNKLLFEKTVQQHELYKEHGYRVFFVWEHDFKTATRKTCPVPIRDVVREYLPPKTASPRPVLKQSKLSFARSK